MSSSRRPPRAAQPSRRPRVAGLRKPEGQGTDPQQPEDVESTESTGTAAGTADTGDAETTAVTEAVREEPAGTGSLGGTLDAGTEDAATSGEPGERETPPAPRTPTPRRKAADRGAPKPVSEDELDVTEPVPEPAFAPATADGETGRAKSSLFAGGRGYVLVAVLLVVAVALGGLAVFFKSQMSSVSAATNNGALLDVGGTTEVKQAMSDATERLFSLDFNDLDKTQKAADELLVGDQVKKEYDLLMTDVRKRAPGQKLVVTAKVTRSAVVALDDDRAKVMVYVDQTGVRQGQQAPSSGGAAMWLDGEKRDGKWKVTNMETYAKAQAAPSAPSGQPSPSAPAPSTPGS